MKIWALLLLLLTLKFDIAAQTDPSLSKALELSKQGQFQQALATIKQAKLGEVPQNHYLYGYILKECYKINEQGKFDSQLRSEAVSELQRTMKLDVKGELKENVNFALNFFATSYYNDALKATIVMDSASLNLPVLLFRKSQEIFQGTETEALNMEQEFLSKLAEAHYKLWIQNTSTDFHLRECVKTYEEIIQKFPGTCDANLNLAIISYNQGIYVIRSAGSQTDLGELFTIQDRSIEKFKAALPFAQKSFDDCKPQEVNYKVLLYINRALGNEAEVKKIQGEMKKKFESK
ncbi:MAG: hypothetical protein ACKO8Q_05055 [Bacteroidota bacterium]